jgi:serine/threonine protein kinase
MQPIDPFGWVGSPIDKKFAIESVVGEGGFGVVYRGVHLGFELPVAVKCLRLPPGTGEQERRRLLSGFREEARLLHQLSRRTANIVQALDIGAATVPNGQWTPYTATDLVSERTADTSTPLVAPPNQGRTAASFERRIERAPRRSRASDRGGDHSTPRWTGAEALRR